MRPEKTSKLKDIKETVAGAAEIIHLIRTPGVQESFDKIANSAKIIKEIIEALKTPEMVMNIEKLRLISENTNNTSTKIQSILKQLDETGVINEAKGLIKSTKSIIDSFIVNGESSINGQDLHEVSTAIKETFRSIRALVDELRITVTYSKKCGAVHSIEEAVKETYDIYKTTLLKENT